MEFFAFDKAYLDRLRAGDSSTEQHFVSYFEPLLRIKLRARMLARDRVDDLQQETFKRVFDQVRREGGIREPQRFGAFVNAVCSHVLSEYYRSSGRVQQMDETQFEVPDKVLDLEGLLVSKQEAERVREVLEEMPKRDRDLLRALFLEEKEKEEICREFRVERDYLRVLLHRAKEKFRALYEKEEAVRSKG